MMRRTFVALACLSLCSSAVPSEASISTKETGLYVLVALDFRLGEHFQHPGWHFDLVTYGTYDSESRLWWVKLRPGLEFKRTPGLASLGFPLSFFTPAIGAYLFSEGNFCGTLLKRQVQHLNVPPGLHTKLAPTLPRPPLVINQGLQ